MRLMIFLLFTLPAISQSSPQAGSEQSMRLGVLLRNCHEQTETTTGYDPSYVRLAYPMGDVPPETGVCADVIIRAFRAVGLDLQVKIHEDMAAHFDAYPKAWGLKRTDKNIDHRRVLNLMKWFERQKKSVPITANGPDYLPGDVVAWRLDNGLPHIGIVSDASSSVRGKPLVIHNIGAGAKQEDVLFSWKIIGHYRFFKP